MIAQESIPYIVVVGAVNIDISGTTITPMVPADSNPGEVTVTLGGVGRNIAENLSRLGARVELVTVLGDDIHAQQIRKNCQELHISLNYGLTIPGQRTSTYLCLNDSNGDVYAAVSDMEIYQHITPAFLESRMELINRASLVVVDANIPEESITYLAKHSEAPLVGDPVSTKKAAKMKGSVGAFAAVKPNRQEASLLTGIQINNVADLEHAARVMMKQGVKNVFITLGGAGVFYANGATTGIQPCYPSNIVNTTGCGDAFFAAMAIGIAQGRDIGTIAQMGQAAAAICAEANTAVSDEITLDKLQITINKGDQ